MNWRVLVNVQLPPTIKVWNEHFEDYVLPLELTEEELFHGQQTVWIGGVWVIKPFRQQGVGNVMVQKTIEMADVAGIATLHI